MEKTGIQDLGGSPPLPPPPSHIPTGVDPERVEPPKLVMISRPDFGKSGRRIQLEANHFKVSVKSPDEIFYQYSVSISYEDKKAVESKGIGRKIIDKLYQTYSSELAGKRFAYDGEKALYTVGPLPRNKQEFTVVLEESIARREGSSGEPSKRSRQSFHSKSYIVEINYATKIPLRSVLLALNGDETDKVQDVLRVLDIILRQQAANRGCLLVRQSFFHDDSRALDDVGGGISRCFGLHSSFRPTHGGLSLNIDVSTTMILTPGPVLEFLKVNQGTSDARALDWVKAKRMLKNMRIKAAHTNKEFKIKGLSDKPCNELYFLMKGKYGDGTHGQEQPEEITVYEYFRRHRNLQLETSAYLPCLDVGKPRRPNYLPLELCGLVSLQRYTKALSSMQRVALVEKSRVKPQERKKILTDSMGKYLYDEDPLLSACGISIEKQLMKFDGRVLEAPKLKVGGDEDCIPQNGRWNFNRKRLMKPMKIDYWAVVNFSARDISQLLQGLINCGRNKGVVIERPNTLIEEKPQYRRASALVRVEKMFDQIMSKFDRPPPYPFILCVLPERKNSAIYGPWKRKCLVEWGIPTQCVSPGNVNDQYLTNVLLKINSKLGGTNSLLALEVVSRVPIIRDSPTMIFGMDVSHGSPGQSDVPSIAAVVGSHSWPLISRYRAAVRTQSRKAEMIESLFKPLPNGKDDDGIMRELLREFYKTTSCRKPSQIVVFRDGVSESQFSQVLNIEIDQIIKTYQFLGEPNIPKFTVVVAQKNHHTKLFQAVGDHVNVPPGTVVDTEIVHPRNYDFYMCAQAGKIGTSRPAHYHVLIDEIGFSADDMQNLVHSLSYVYQRSTTAISIVAPVYYAHLAATQAGKLIKSEESSDTSSGHGSHTSAANVPVPELPRLHDNVAGSMFFC
ncbi:hypothetical protein ACET3Z_022992 [Daucus carota]